MGWFRGLLILAIPVLPLLALYDLSGSWVVAFIAYATFAGMLYLSWLYFHLAAVEEDDEI